MVGIQGGFGGVELSRRFRGKGRGDWFKEVFEGGEGVASVSRSFFSWWAFKEVLVGLRFQGGFGGEGVEIGSRRFSGGPSISRFFSWWAFKEVFGERLGCEGVFVKIFVFCGKGA